MHYPRLGVNIDHVATLRQQRGEFYPELTRGAQVALASGANQITIHLREDRRHIQDHDVPQVHRVCQHFQSPLNLEIGLADEIIDIAIEEKPDWICLVPEKREERTTEGGLDVLNPVYFERLKLACERIKKSAPQTKISLFVEADPQVITKCLGLYAHAVEIHTGEYARDFLKQQDLSAHLKKFRECHRLVKEAGWGFHAGHGLSFESLVPLLEEKKFEEYNIGHWIICESVFIGLGHVIKEMQELIKKYPIEGPA
jgi:pyridoxine 5-phosphate synthase